MWTIVRTGHHCLGIAVVTLILATESVSSAGEGALAGTIVIPETILDSQLERVPGHKKRKDPVPGVIVYLKSGFEDMQADDRERRVDLDFKPGDLHPAISVQRSPFVLRIKNSSKLTSSFLKTPRLEAIVLTPGDSKDLLIDVPHRKVVHVIEDEGARASVLALQHPYFSMTDANGKWKIGPIPSGKHRLVFTGGFDMDDIGHCEEADATVERDRTTVVDSQNDAESRVTE